MASVLYIFNPEHDLCLANGDRHYMPPSSAVQFAFAGVEAMRILYGDDACVVAAAGYGEWKNAHPDFTPSRIVPWGWNLRLKQQLVELGVASELLPDDDRLERMRKLQHRATLLPLQPHALQCCDEASVSAFVEAHGEVVMKSPWSGAGRGLRWVSRQLGEKDCFWLHRVLRQQGSVVVEQRFRRLYDFAIEYVVEQGHVRKTGYSLFETQSGVYRCNHLLADADIRRQVGIGDALEERLLTWLDATVAPYYEGPLGVDLFTTEDGSCIVCEMNLRHTMGMVAHSYLERRPWAVGERWIFSPTDIH